MVYSNSCQKMTIATDVIAKLVRSLPVLSGITEFGFFCLPKFPMHMFTDDVITCQPTPHPNQTLYLVQFGCGAGYYVVDINASLHEANIPKQ